MQTINSQFFKFLNSNFDKSEIKLEVFDQFNAYFTMLRNYKHIPTDFDSNLSIYPIFPNSYKYYSSLQITSTASFSSQKIISTALPNSEYLSKSNVTDNLKSIVTKIEKIPNKIDDIDFSYLTQKLFIDNDYFNNYMLSIQQNNVYENDYLFYNLLFTDTIECDYSYNNLNLIQLTTMFFSLYSLYTKTYSIKDGLFLYFYTLDSEIQPLTTSNLSLSFESFLTDKVYDDIYVDLTEFILKNNFDIIIPVESVVTDTKDYLTEVQLPELVTVFTEFLNSNYTDLLKHFFNTSFNKCDNFIFYNIFKKLITTTVATTILKEIKTTLSNKLCNDYIDTLLSGLNTYELQKYLLPIFLTSTYPIKFINIIPQFIKEFITDNFLTISEYEELFLESEVLEVTSTTINNLQLKSSEISQFFSELDISEIYKSNDLGGLISSMFVNEIFQDFTDGDEFSTFIENMLDGVYLHLYSKRLITYDQNWYTCIELTKAFLKSFFFTYINYQTTDTYENRIFPSLQIYLDSYFSDNSITYTGTTEKIESSLAQQINNSKLTSDVYNSTKNVFYGHLNKTIYNKILTYYVNT